MSLVFFFDGIRQSKDDIRGSDASSFVYRKKDASGGAALSFSPSLELFGAAYDLVRDKIINSSNPALQEVEVLGFDDCCKDENGNMLLLINGKILGSEVEWCELGSNCGSCEVSIFDNSEDAIALSCLKNTLIWDRKEKFDGSGVSLGEDSFRPANLISYCNDIRPDAIQEVTLLLGLILKIVILPALGVVATIITVINAILFFINLLGANIPLIGGDVSFFNDAQQLIQAFDELIISCGFLHKAPFVQSYMQNLCDVCGLGFQSSLFEVGGPYHNTMRLDAPYVKGSKKLSQAFLAYEKNKPNLNGVQFLDELEQFNIEWRISNGSLIVEREDFNFGVQWFDLRDIPNENINSLCFSIVEEQAAAYGEYNYVKDGVDNTGDEVYRGWADAVFDWNVPVNPSQSGLKETSLFFGAAQFRQDSNRPSVSPLDKPIYTLGFLALQDFQNTMLMEKGVCAFPKLLQWDGTSGRFNAKVDRKNSVVQDTFDYNTDWWVKSSYQDASGTSYNTAYQNLFEIDDPRAAGIKKRGYTLEIVSTCDLVRTLSVDKFITIPLGGVYKQAFIDEIEYNTDTRLLTIQGTI